MLDLENIDKLSKQDLANAINYLIEEDFHALIQVLYRLDINEKLLKQTLHDNKEEDAGVMIADMIIKRQTQKEEFKKQFMQELIELRDSANINSDTIQNMENENDKKHDQGNLSQSL